MHGQPKVFGNAFNQRRRIQPRFRPARGVDEAQHLGGKLVRAVRPALGRQ